MKASFTADALIGSAPMAEAYQTWLERKGEPSYTEADYVINLPSFKGRSPYPGYLGKMRYLEERLERAFVLFRWRFRDAIEELTEQRRDENLWFLGQIIRQSGTYSRRLEILRWHGLVTEDPRHKEEYARVYRRQATHSMPASARCL